MTATIPPAVSDALREAVARVVCTALSGTTIPLNGLPPGHWLLRVTDDLCSPDGPIASEIARLTGERDAAIELVRRARESITVSSQALDLAKTVMLQDEATIEAAEAETARLRAALEKIAAKTEREYFGDQEYVYGKSQPYRERPTPDAQIARAALSSQEKTDA
jgi:hypothetical protein